MKYVIAAVLLLSTSCARNTTDIGSIVRTQYLECINTPSPYTCNETRCVLTETVLGKYFWNDRVLSKRVIPDINCI